MNRIRYLAAGLLCLNGVIHLARLGFPPLDAAFVTVVVVFGAAYLIIGGFLFRDSRTAYYFGAIVPFIGFSVGLCGGLMGLLAKPSAWMVFLSILDASIALSCLYLIKAKRSV
jgi:hypothetical protein